MRAWTLSSRQLKVSFGDASVASNLEKNKSVASSSLCCMISSLLHSFACSGVPSICTRQCSAPPTCDVVVQHTLMSPHTKLLSQRSLGDFRSLKRSVHTEFVVFTPTNDMCTSIYSVMPTRSSNRRESHHLRHVVYQGHQFCTHDEHDGNHVLLALRLVLLFPSSSKILMILPNLPAGSCFGQA